MHYTIQCTPYSVHSTLYLVQCMLTCNYLLVFPNYDKFPGMMVNLSFATPRHHGLDFIFDSCHSLTLSNPAAITPYHPYTSQSSLTTRITRRHHPNATPNSIIIYRQLLLVHPSKHPGTYRGSSSRMF